MAALEDVFYGRLPHLVHACMTPCFFSSFILTGIGAFHFFFFMFEPQILKVVPTCETRYRTTWLTSCQILQHRCIFLPLFTHVRRTLCFSMYVHVSLHARAIHPSFVHLTLSRSFLSTPRQVTDGTSTAPPPPFRPMVQLSPHTFSPPTKVLISPYLHSFLSILPFFLHTFLFFLLWCLKTTLP